MTLKIINYFHIRSCKYKTKFMSLKDTLNHLLKKRKEGIDVDSCYKCVFCDGYHIGHYPKTIIRKRNRRIIRYLKENKSIILTKPFQI